MSDDGQTAMATTNGQTGALDVGFKSLVDRHGETSSQAESRSSGRRSENGSGGGVGSARIARTENNPRSTPTPTKGKQNALVDGLRHSGSSARRKANKSGGFLLDPLFANGSPRASHDRYNGKGKAAGGGDTSPPVGRKRQVQQDRISYESSSRGGDSPLSRQVSMSASTAPSSNDHNRPTSRPQSMDPTQLVQMALNLSESRKRNISGTLPVPVATARRDVSGGSANGMRLSSSGRDRLSRLSNRSGEDSGTTRTQENDVEPEDSMETAADNVVYTFTPATLSRAERARKYFEQASEYRRLLQHLPPLQPPAAGTDKANERFSPTKSSKVDSSRQLSVANAAQQLGRTYNPIQSLRNRRVRIRGRRPFPVTEEDWQNTDRVRRWVDNVQDTSQDPDYRVSESQVNLPDYPGFDDAQDAQKHEMAKGRRRADTASSVITRPENSWTIEPSELLADAYWTERDGNKHWLEDRRGNLLYPGRGKTNDEDLSRASVDSRAGRDHIPEEGDGLDDIDGGRLARRRKLTFPLKGTDPRRHKRLLSRASSPSSTTSVDDPMGPRTTQSRSGDANIGPLEKYIQEQIAKEEKEARGEFSSPEAAEPSDRWELMHRQSIDQAQHGAASHRTTHQSRASLEVPSGFHRRSQSADGRVNSFDSTVMSSADETEPDEFSLAAGMEPSLTQSSTHNAGHKSKRSKLGLFRAHSKERHQIAQTDFATNGAPLAPILSADTGRGGGRVSMDSARLGTFTRHRTTESISSTLSRADTNNTTGSVAFGRDPGSSVGRFFKGGRIGDFVRGESARFGDRMKGRERPGDMNSDTDDNASTYGIRRTNTDDSVESQRPSLDRARTTGPKYHMSNLPAFTSANRERRPGLGTPMSTNENRPSLTGGPRDSEKSDHVDLPPNAPRIALSNNFNASNPELAQDPTASLEQRGLGNYGPLQLKSNTARAALGVRGLSPKRHWSISDQGKPAAPTTGSAAEAQISKRDIARVRALLLSSGIKAREIQRRADSPRNPPNRLLVRAAATAQIPVPTTVPRKEDDSAAARILSEVIDTRVSTLESALESFTSHTTAALASRLDALHARVAEDLSVKVRDTSDSADAFVVELTTKQPQQTKRVDDAVDAMLRLRRRQFRLLRRAGFKLLEWFTLGLMWGIWGAVVLLNLVRRLVVVLLVVLRWLFSF